MMAVTVLWYIQRPAEQIMMIPFKVYIQRKFSSKTII